VARNDRWCVLFLIALATLLFADVLFLGSNFFYRDLYLYHFPMKHIVRETIGRGEFPLWNRYFSGGQPMAANPAYEIFYPPQWLIFVGSYPFGFALHILVHIDLALLGMYALLRSIPLQVPASLMGAITFGIGGFLLGSITNLPTFFVWSWAPLVGLTVLRLARQPDARRFAVAVIVATMPLLVGEPMALAQLWFLIIVVTLSFMRHRFLLILGVFAAALVLAAVQIIPAIDLIRDSSRVRGFDYRTIVDFSMPWVRPLELIAPRVFGILPPDAHAFWGYQFFGSRPAPYLLSIYCGLPVVIFALAGFIARLRGSRVTGLVVALSYLLAIGGHTPLFRWAYTLGLRSIRYPEKFAAMGIVALIVFAATAADRFLAGDPRVRRVARTIAFTIAGFVVLLALVAPSVFLRAFQLTPASSAIVPIAARTWWMAALVAVAWAALLGAWRDDRRLRLLGLLLLLVDLGAFSREVAPRMPRAFFTSPPIVDALDRDRDAYRIFNRGEWIHDQNLRQLATWSVQWFARNAVRPYTNAAWGLSSVLEADFDETALLPTHDLLALMIKLGSTEPFMAISNVRYVIDYRDFNTVMSEVLGHVEVWRPARLRRVADPGRYWFPQRLVDSPEKVTYGAACVAAGFSRPAPGRVTAIRETSNTATIDVDATGTTLLVASVTRHKYWSATIDGHPAQLLPANIAYQALVVPQGRHRIEMRYSNPLLWWGGAVSALALIALLCAAARRLNVAPLDPTRSPA
jgi:hypothetical protein